MEFQPQRPIYRQIVELLCDRIVSGELQAERRMPSVREVAAQVAVNPNTVMRSFEHMQQKGIIFNTRGVGYFVSTEAKDIILAIRRKEFVDEVWPQVRQRMKELELTLSDLGKLMETKVDTEQE